MQKEADTWILSRRSVLALAGAGLVARESLYASTDFWNKKDPSQWTGEQIDQLTSKSPWAKSVSAQAPPGGNGGYGQGYPNGGGYPRGGGGMGGPGIGIGGMGRRRGMGGGGYPGGGRPAGTTYKGTVRWESAQPILDALKNPLPDAFAKHYVIGVRDIPLIEDQSRRQDNGDQDSSNSDRSTTLSKRTMDDLKLSTTLQPKGREMVSADVVQQMTPGGTYFLFGFAKDRLDFGKNDREVAFATRLGRILVKAKFDMKEMLYHGKLAV
jgi:hypothetical protein